MKVVLIKLWGSMENMVISTDFPLDGENLRINTSRLTNHMKSTIPYSHNYHSSYSHNRNTGLILD